MSSKSSDEWLIPIDWSISHYVEVWQSVNEIGVQIDGTYSWWFVHLDEFDKDKLFWGGTLTTKDENLIWFGSLSNPSELKRYLPWIFI